MTGDLRGSIAVLIASAAFVVNAAIIKAAELPSGKTIGVLGTGESAVVEPFRNIAAPLGLRSDIGGGAVCRIPWPFSALGWASPPAFADSTVSDTV